MISAIVFDLGNVLIHFDADLACLQLAEISSCHKEEIYRFLYQSGLELKFERGDLNFDELCARFHAQFDPSISKEALRHAACNIFSPNQSVINLVVELKHNHPSLKLGLLSNTNEIHWDHIEKHWNISALFDEVVLSFREKSLKPEPLIYERALERLGVPAFQCVYIDDLLVNVEGGIRSGFQGIQFLNEAQLRKNLRDFAIKC